jgi:hypothetical protein
LSDTGPVPPLFNEKLPVPVILELRTPFLLPAKRDENSSASTLLKLENVEPEKESWDSRTTTESC